MGALYFPARSCAGKIINLTLINTHHPETLPAGSVMRVTHVVTSHHHGWVILADESTPGQSVTMTVPATFPMPVLSR